MLLFSCLFFSCEPQKENSPKLLKELYRNSKQSSDLIKGYNITLLKTLEDRLNDPRTAERTRLFYPSAKRVKEISDSALKLLEDFNTALILNSNGQGFEFAKNKAVEEILNKWPAFHTYFKKYQRDIFTVDTAFDEIYKNPDIKNDEFGFIPATNLDSILPESDLKMLSAGEFALFISILEKNILFTENVILYFCSMKTVSNFDGYWSIIPLMHISSTCVKEGEQIEVTAGVGAFETSSHPEIIINGTKIESELGYGTYTFNTPQKAGKYFVPVKIILTDPIDGKQKLVEKNLSYTVVK